MIKKEDFYSVVSRRIKEERKRLNLTQEELAEKVDMSYKFLSAIERNAEKPSLDMIVRLAEALNISAEKLLTKNTDKKNKIENKYNKNLINKFEFLVSDLNQDQQEHIINIIKEAKKLLK